MGSRIVARAAVSASADPLMLAISTAAAMATYPRPPEMCPTHACAMSMIRRLIPPEFISSPARTKNGTASSGKLSTPATRFCASNCVSQKLSAQAIPAPVSTSESAMFMPVAISTSMPTEKIRNASVSGLMIIPPQNFRPD
jgi:hypothetical protein